MDNLTQNKLENATKIDELSKQLASKDVSLKHLQTKSDELIIENEALKRQNQRITDENDSLLSEMDTMDKNKTSNEVDEKVATLQKQYDEKCNELTSMKDLNDNNSNKIKKLIQENSDLKASIESSNSPVEEVKVKYDVVVKKLKVYREKLITIYDHAKLLKAEKAMLLSMTKEYGENVSTWQKDIANASTRLIIQLKELKGDIKEKDEEIEKLKKELQTANATPASDEEISNLKKEVYDLNEALKAKEKLLEDEREAQKKLKQAVKKTSVLDLEMEAYEKTLDEINKKLEAKKKQVTELEATITVQNETVNSLKKEIAALEENLESEKTHSTELKKNLDTQQNLLRKTEHERTEANLQLDLLRKNFESLKLENSDSKVAMSKTVGDMEKRHQQLETERTNLTSNISFLESEVEKYRKLSSTHEKEIENLRSEFVSYKIRAQSVLRQNQTKDLSREQELQDEVITLQSRLEGLKESNHKLNHELENLKKNYGDLVEDKVRLQGRCKDLLSTLEKQSEEMLEESRKRNQEHDESVKAYQLQIDTLNTFYKKRTQELEDGKKSAVTELQQKISALEKSASIPSTPVAAAYESPPRNDDHKMSNMLDLMDREVEGSEDQSSQSTYAFTSSKRKTSKNRDLIPLDELLNSSFDDNSNEINEDTISNYSSRSEVLEHLRGKLQKEENRVTHLTSLLSDSEKDLARMQQLNDVLKEEVRRHQRSIEREQHIQNSEYLKNIVIKFVTLSNGDEKQRLIPVMNTILKLSSEELKTLQDACKGGWGLWNK